MVRLSGLAICALLLGVIGCADKNSPATRKKAAPLPPRYAALPERENVPPFMQGTIWEATEVQNNRPYQVSAYGLVVGLSRTGNNNGTPLAVRNQMIDEMVKHGFGSQVEGLRHLKPEMMLRDPRTAIVEVYGHLPVGARAGQRIDTFVQAVTGSQTRSLAGGTLYLTDLRINGVDPLYPKGSINIYAKAKGPIFVNPSYVMATENQASQVNLRSGIIMNGGLVMEDRPIWLRTRQPQLSTSRVIGDRINHRFPPPNPNFRYARTQDEGLTFILVPRQYNGDWEHFVGVVNHLYLNAAPGFLVHKAQELAQEAQKPGALLMNISYCWEGIGESALDFIRPLYGHSSQDVAFAAARAGAFIGDAAAEQALATMASIDQHPFQYNAVKALGALPESVRVTRMLSALLSSSNAMVRVEAYRILAEWEAPIIMSQRVRDQFIIDRIPTDGPPLLYAARSGIPRIAIFGRDMPLKTPIMFSALGSQLTISTAADGRSLVLFDRTHNAPPGGQQARSRPDLHELIWRLGGGNEDGFAFTYSDLVGILKSLSDERFVAANFVLQDMPVMLDDIEDAPPIIEPAGRSPVAEAAGNAPASALTRTGAEPR
jgi:hypothetical protein